MSEERDREIGKSVTALRGDRSQQSVAEEMRARGHKWSQATVWSVEKGDRPLRLTEAEDLAAVLMTDLRALTMPSGQAINAMLIRRLHRDAISSQHKAARIELPRMIRSWQALRESLDALDVPDGPDMEAPREYARQSLDELMERVRTVAMAEVERTREELKGRIELESPVDDLPAVRPPRAKRAASKAVPAKKSVPARKAARRG